MQKLVIEIEGGIVQAAYGNTPTLLTVLDHDLEQDNELADLGGFTYELDVTTTPRDNPLYRCDNCRTVCERGACEPAIDLFERLDPGSIYTDCQCPECGALTYPYPPQEST